MSEDPRAGDRAMARFSVAMSGGTDEDCRDHGAISADGATATSKGGPGWFRAVCETVARGGGVWEGALHRRSSSDTIVALFICIGAPNADTWHVSKNVLAKWVNTTGSYIRGSTAPGSVALALPVGGTLSWRIDCAAGTVHARVDDGAWALLFNDITPAEVASGLHVGVILDGDAEVKLLSFGRVDAAAVPKAVAVRAPWG